MLKKMDMKAFALTETCLITVRLETARSGGGDEARHDDRSSGAQREHDSMTPDFGISVARNGRNGVGRSWV